MNNHFCHASRLLATSYDICVHTYIRTVLERTTRCGPLWGAPDDAVASLLQLHTVSFIYIFILTMWPSLIMQGRTWLFSLLGPERATFSFSLFWPCALVSDTGYFKPCCDRFFSFCAVIMSFSLTLR